ncbi:MAG: hypothetical protein Q4Q53_05490 [Methanocorpusculum sp.]|nr:hypothetical protein [Methanocorpusculum sp.]
MAWAEAPVEGEGTDGYRALETPISIQMDTQEGFPWLTDDMTNIMILPYVGRLGDEKSGDIWIHIIDAFEQTAQGYIESHMSFMPDNGEKQLSDPVAVQGLGGLEGYLVTFQGSDGSGYTEYAFVLEGNYLLIAVARDESGEASAQALSSMLKIQ